jgi:hypothetical protein
MRSVGFLLMLVSIATASFAQATTPHFAKDLSYEKVRATLLRQGWKPMSLTPTGQCGWAPDQCPKVPEVVFCAGAGALVPCYYAWRKGNAFIEIEGHGEGAPQAYLKTISCRQIVRGDPRYVSDWKCVH